MILCSVIDADMIAVFVRGNLLNDYTLFTSSLDSSWKRQCTCLSVCLYVLKTISCTVDIALYCLFCADIVMIPTRFVYSGATAGFSTHISQCFRLT